MVADQKFSFVDEEQKRMHMFTTAIQHYHRALLLEQLDQKSKGTHIGKEKVKLCLFTENMILCIQNSKESIRKLLELINPAIKVTRSLYKNSSVSIH